MNWFLGVTTPSAAAIVRHFEYIGALVGFDHVGLGLDFLFDRSDAAGVIAKWPQLASIELGDFACAGPDVLPAIASELRVRDHGDEVAAKVMGGNFLRVAEAAWEQRVREPPSSDAAKRAQART